MMNLPLFLRTKVHSFNFLYILFVWFVSALEKRAEKRQLSEFDDEVRVQKKLLQQMSDFGGNNVTLINSIVNYNMLADLLFILSLLKQPRRYKENKKTNLWRHF